MYRQWRLVIQVWSVVGLRWVPDSNDLGDYEKMITRHNQSVATQQHWAATSRPQLADVGAAAFPAANARRAHAYHATEQRQQARAWSRHEIQAGQVRPATTVGNKPRRAPPLSGAGRSWSVSAVFASSSSSSSSSSSALCSSNAPPRVEVAKPGSPLAAGHGRPGARRDAIMRGWECCKQRKR